MDVVRPGEQENFTKAPDYTKRISVLFVALYNINQLDWNVSLVIIEQLTVRYHAKRKE